MFIKEVKYIADLENLQSLQNKAISKPKLIISITDYQLVCEFEYVVETVISDSATEINIKKIVTKEKLPVFRNKLSIENMMLVDNLAYIRDGLELSTVSLILNKIIIPKYEEWFKENILELYNLYILHYKIYQ